MSLTVDPILCRAGTMNNYAYLVTDTDTGRSAVIDASEAEPVIAECERLRVKPEFILTTHHHFDHVGGNAGLKRKYGLKIVAPLAEKDLIEDADIFLRDNEEFALGKVKIKALSAAGHTLGHMLYYMPEEKVLFTGDTLFNLCIGGLFEGTPSQMWNSLQKIRSLPDDVVFYPGHEYTGHCLEEALHRSRTPEMEQYAGYAISRLNAGLPVAPVALGLEKQCNPYLRIKTPEEFARLF